MTGENKDRNGPPGNKTGANAQADRKARQAEQLRANLRKRKAQQRGRAEDTPHTSNGQDG